MHLRYLLLFLTSFALSAASTKISLYVQPVKGTTFKINGVAAKAKIRGMDKSIGEIELSADDLEATLTIENVQLKSRRDVKISSIASGAIPLIVLDRSDAKHRFVRRIATGKQPKSATFISARKVVLPLLDDNHSEVIDIETGVVTRLEVPQNYAKKGGFVESVRVPPLKEFWVSQMMASAIHRFDAETLAYKGTIDLTGKWTKVLAYDAKRNVVYASNWNSADISVVSVSELREVKKIKLKGTPRGMAFSADGQYMLAAFFGGASDSDGQGKTQKIDLDTQKVVDTVIKGGTHRHAVRLKGEREIFAVSDMAKSRVYFVEDFEKKSETPVQRLPNTIAESPDGKYLYVSCRGRNGASYLKKGPELGHLNVIDLKTRKVVEEIEAGNQPTGLDVSPDGKYVVLTDFLDHAMRVYERVD